MYDGVGKDGLLMSWSRWWNRLLYKAIKGSKKEYVRIEQREVCSHILMSTFGDKVNEDRRNIKVVFICSKFWKYLGG